MPIPLLFDADAAALPVLGLFCGFYLVIALVALASLAVWIWMLVDCATKERSEGNDRLVWILIIALTGVVGALIYLFVRRPQRKRELGR